MKPRLIFAFLLLLPVLLLGQISSETPQTWLVQPGGYQLYGDGNHTNAMFYGPSGLIISNANGLFYFKGGSGMNLTNLQFGGYLNYSNGALTLSCPTNSAAALVINTNTVFTNGFFGLGKVNPSYPLDISYSTAGESGLQFYNPNSSGTASLRLNCGARNGVYLKYNFNVSSAAELLYGGSGNVIFLDNGNVGFNTRAPTTNLCVAGEIAASSLYVTNDVSALTFTDRSEAPADAAEASKLLATITVTNRMIDHTTLDPALWGKKAVYTDTGLKTTNIVAEVKDAEGRITQSARTNITSIIKTDVVPDQTKRNLSMLVSAQALIIQDLLKRVEALEKR